MSSRSTGSQKENALKVFTLDQENNITVYSSPRLAVDSGDPVFATPAELTKLSDSWPAARFVEIWNSLTGVVAVKRFTDRKTAVTRIWKAIQNLEAAEPVKNVELRCATSKKERVLAMLQTNGGATLGQLMGATGWQSHSVRGFLSGTISKKMGRTVESSKREDGERVYRVLP
jgi:Protein of unknown function (DUF3489)